MPRRIVISVADQLVKYAMTAPIEEVTALLKTATTIVTVRAGKPSDVVLPGTRGRRAGSPPLATGPLQGVKPATTADVTDLAAARQRANAATGVRDPRPRGPRASRPAVTDPPPAQTAGTSAGPVDTD